MGPDEFKVRDGEISVDSPLAKALLGKSLDDEVTIQSPAGEKNFLILEINYTNPNNNKQ